jgi:phenylacetate-coenzyme A ligase PaaK-like adenylate-forming protein
MKSPFLRIRSALPGLAWPAITGPDEATALALQYQLERSQWLPAEDLRALQLRQLDALVRHAWLTVPYYRWQWHGGYRSGETLDHEGFERLPLLTREHLQYEFEGLKSNAPPAAHGAISESRTAGTTGSPVRALKTALTRLWWQVLMLRHHLWHRRDFEGPLATIRDWDVPLTDLYAADEAGCIALQCPDHEHYHVQSESVLVEVLDVEGRACAPGAVGRVVVTTLQNFAMPLVRYDIGDVAEAGDPCPCGRGLPVLRRIARR